MFTAIASVVREHFLTKTGPLLLALGAIALWLFMVAVPLVIDAPAFLKAVSATLVVLPVVTLAAVLLYRQKEIESARSAFGALLCVGGGLFVLWRMGCMFDLVCL